MPPWRIVGWQKVAVCIQEHDERFSCKFPILNEPSVFFFSLLGRQIGLHFRFFCLISLSCDVIRKRHFCESTDFAMRKNHGVLETNGVGPDD